MSPTAVHELCFRCVAHLYCNKTVSNGCKLRAWLLAAHSLLNIVLEREVSNPSTSSG